MSQGGLENKKISFVINDSQITSDFFLDDINSLLNSGDIPNLMSIEEKDQIINKIKPQVIGETSNENIYETFI